MVDTVNCEIRLRHSVSGEAFSWAGDFPVAAMTKLVFLSEPFAGRTYDLAVEKTTVGRGEHNTLTIHDDSVSQTHGEILVCGSEVIVRDLGSSNGTFVNGERLQREQRPVKAGQTVMFGSVEARLEREEERSGFTSTEMTAVREQSQHERERRGAAARSASPESGLGSNLPPARTGHTVLLPAPARVPRTGSPSGLQEGRSPGRPRSSMMQWILLGVAIAAAILIWALMGK